MSTSSSSVWIGDIETWMDESYIRSIFKNIGILLNNLSNSKVCEAHEKD